MYINFRCRKCGKILYKDIGNQNYRYANMYGATFSNASHKDCPIDGEKVFADMISVSETPLPDSVFIGGDE